MALEALLAQIIPDNTLGNESSVIKSDVVVKDKLVDLIEAGAIRDDNLFHSFEQFNIENGNAVYFNNPEHITNILTRVTGNNISEILGTLGVNGTANLFLLNPNGIIFGENASLDVNGSFLATTADSYIFNNSFEYSATNPEVPPLLTVNTPLGLQFGSSTGDIKVLDTGQTIIAQSDRNLALVSFSPKTRTFGTESLKVAPEKTLSLVGGNVTLQGSSLRAEQGRIELGGVDDGFVGLQPTPYGWNLDYSEVSTYKDINLREFSAIDASGITSQGIQLVGKQIEVSDGSTALIQILGSAPAANLTVSASQLLEIDGSDLPSLLSSSVSIENFGLESGDVTVTAPNLIVRNGGGIGSRQYVRGEASNVYMNIADSIVLDGASLIVPGYYSRIGVLNFGSSEGGNLNVSTNKLILKDGANVGSATAFGIGTGGNVDIVAAESIEIVGKTLPVVGADELPSTINAITLGDGDAGTISVETTHLRLSDGGNINSATFDNGNAGEIAIDVSDSIELNDTNEDGLTAISSNGSNLNAFSKSLFELPEVIGGDSGKITINTNRLSLKNSEIKVSNEGIGSAGNLEINSNTIALQNQADILANTTSGEGGNIVLQVSDLLSLQNSSSINATAKGNGNGGNINIDSDLVSLLDRSQIIANAFKGNGGNIDLTTQRYFISADSLVSASSQLGLDGEVEVETINEDRTIELDSLPKTPIDAAEQITSGCSFQNDFEIAGKGGLPDNPAQYLRSNTIWQDLRNPEFNNQQIHTQALSTRKYSPLTEANHWQVNSQGNIELVASNYRGDRSIVTLNNFNCTQNFSSSFRQ